MLLGFHLLAIAQRFGCIVRQGMMLLWSMVLVLLSGPLHAAPGSAWDALCDEHAVLLLRHATAPGFGDPPGFVLGDCRSQRNLDDRGRREAQRWGELLRQQWIERPRLYSSRWCRALGHCPGDATGGRPAVTGTGLLLRKRRARRTADP
ncbi:hypothetical protein GCM10027514_33530 [Azotobacter armeniacus]